MGKGLDNTFLQRRHINKFKMYQKVLQITNCQGNTNQTTMRCHLIPLIKSTKDIKCWRGCGKIGTTALDKNEIATATKENSMQFPQQEKSF